MTAELSAEEREKAYDTLKKADGEGLLNASAQVAEAVWATLALLKPAPVLPEEDGVYLAPHGYVLHKGAAGWFRPGLDEAVPVEQVARMLPLTRLCTEEETVRKVAEWLRASVLQEFQAAAKRICEHFGIIS